jgi:hypothetical protein
MKFHGVLFRPELVVAIREGRKTQTRRLPSPRRIARPEGWET